MNQLPNKLEHPLVRELFVAEGPFEEAAGHQFTSVLPLNQSQLDAVAYCLAAPTVGLIHGPPGTGKTTTLTELLYQLAR